MNINLSKKEYAALLDMLEIADWIMTSHDADEEPKETVYSGLLNKIYSHAKEMGCEDMIEYDEKVKKYFPTQLFEDESAMFEFIEDYNAATFWEELIDRLVNRDMLSKYGVEKINAMPVEERLTNRMPFEEKYAVEFEEQGVDNLYLSNPNLKIVS